MWHDTITYRDYRPGYLPGFFQDAAERIPLLGHESLLDLGCGTASVAMGFAPFVSRLTGIDFEREMLDEAGRRIAAVGRRMELIHAAVENAPRNLGTFDVITIGRAHWYLRTPEILKRIDEWLAPDGVVLICHPEENRTPADEPWLEAFFDIRTKWAVALGVGDYARPAADFFDGSPLVLVDEFTAVGGQTVDIEHLVNRLLGYPSTTRNKLGLATDDMVADVRSTLAPYFTRGTVYERLITRGWMFRRGP